jgi:zinc transporter 2
MSDEILLKKNQTLKDQQQKSKESLNKLVIVSIVCTVFMIIELIGGYMADSIAIMSDAAHMLSDLLGFIISIFSIIIASRKSNTKMTYGYHRAEVIGALTSIVIIWGLTFWLIAESIERISNPVKVNGTIMLITAVLGLLFNIAMAFILAANNIYHDHAHEQEGEQAPKKATKIRHNKMVVEEENINVRAALVHVIGDAVQNVGIIIASLVIFFYPELAVADSICTLIFAVIVMFTTFKIVGECLEIIMESGEHLSAKYQAVTEDLKALKEEGKILGYHDWHFWNLSAGKTLCSGHINCANGQTDEVLKIVAEVLKMKHGLRHCAIQVENEDNYKNGFCKQDIHEEFDV